MSDIEQKKQKISSGTIISEKFNEPGMYKVVLINDDYTPMDFVVFVLVQVFHMPQEKAADLMFKVHKTGEAVVGIFVYDIAVTRCLQVLNVAKENGFPLQCKVEEE